MTESLESRVGERVKLLAPNPGVLLVAVSGGPDSLALLELLWRSRQLHGHELIVGHVDHGIHTASSEVADRVQSEAADRGLEARCRRLELGSESTETTARLERRRALREIVAKSGAEGVVLGHHAEDQAETVMLRVLGGSGPAGLGGMAPRRGIWLRPLLEINQSELLAYLAERDLSAWQDPANIDPKHLRSWLRTVALPLLEKRVPDLTAKLNQLADHATERRVAWNQIPELLPDLDVQHRDGSISVAAPVLVGYRSEVQHAVIAALGRRMGVSIGGRNAVRITALIETGRSGGKLSLAKGLEAELSFGRLVLRRPIPAPFDAIQLVAGESFVAGEHALMVALVGVAPTAQREGSEASFAQGAYVARPWRPGDRIRPLGGTGSRSVAQLFKEARVESGRRANWPVLVPATDLATIVWVPGICRSEGCLPTPGEEALSVECDLAWT